MKRDWHTIVAFCCACAGGAAAAQAVDESTSGIAACAAIESAVARLDCFDALAREVRGQAAPEASSATAPAPAGASAAPRREAPANILTEPATAPPAGPSRREARAADRAEREVTSEVAAIREIQPGRIEVTLANGQVWRQTNSDRYNLLVGHVVRLYPSGFGRYFRLSSKELRSFIQVERVR